MAVQIPKLKRFEPVQPASAGRIQAQAQGAGRIQASVSQSVQNFGQAAIETFEKIKKDQIETTSRDAINRYERWHNKKLEGDPKTGEVGLRHIEGDPTEAYNNFEREAEKKRKELLQRVNLGDEGKSKVAQYLDKKETSLYNKRLTSYGAQSDQYRENVKNSALELETNNAAEFIGLFDGQDESTLRPFEYSLDEISNIVVRDGLKDGTAQRVEDGQGDLEFTDEDGETYEVKLNGSAKLEMFKHRSNAASQAINSLLGTRDIEKAKIIFDRYGGNLDSVTKAKLKEKMGKVEVEVKAFQALSKMEGKDFAEQKRQIRNLPSRTHEQRQVRQEALKMVDANERYRTNLSKRDSKQIYNKLHAKIYDRMRSSDPYSSGYEMEHDKEIEPLLDRVTDAKQRKALFDLVDGKKDIQSDLQVKAMLHDQLADGQFFGMPFADLQENMVGLNAKDAKVFEREWRKQNTETDAQEASRSRRLSKMIREHWTAKGLFNKVDGSITKQSQEEFSNFLTEMYSQFDALPPNMSVREMNDWVNRVISREAQRQKDESKFKIPSKILKFFNMDTIGEGDPDIDPTAEPLERSRFEGGGPLRLEKNRESGSPPPSIVKFGDLSASEQDGVIELFERENPKRKAKDVGVDAVMKWFNSRDR